MTYLEGDFPGVLRGLRDKFLSAPRVENARWQGRDMGNDPAARMYELRNVCFEADLGGIEDLDHWRQEVQPNLPWADLAFEERVGGQPLNPGKAWESWPWGKSADRFRSGDQMFNHSYPERLWPKYARQGREASEGRLPLAGGRGEPPGAVPARGIGHSRGDLLDLVDLLVRDPYTRQAWIPLFFPEDTGWGDGGRKMCSLGYQFLRRGNDLSVWYPLRSCDLVRHFRDDVYLAVRMLLWVLQQCRRGDADRWVGCRPGTYAMHMTSLHCFENDMVKMRNEATEVRGDAG